MRSPASGNGDVDAASEVTSQPAERGDSLVVARSWAALLSHSRGPAGNRHARSILRNGVLGMRGVSILDLG